MLKFSAFLGLVFLGSLAHAQLRLEKGEHLLRGTLVQSKSGDHLILNSPSQMMTVVDLKPSATEKLRPYQSGLKVEACVNIGAKSTPNFAGDVRQMRVLAPLEPVVFYSGDLPGCKPQHGCQNFNKPIGSKLSSTVLIQNLPASYFACKK